MKLHDVNSKEQLEEYYRFNNLHATEEKVNYLKSAMKIRAVLHDEDETLDEVLAGLEESALLGYWKASW